MEAAITEINGLGWFQIRTALLIVRDQRPTDMDQDFFKFETSAVRGSLISGSTIGCTGTLANASLFWSSFAT